LLLTGGTGFIGRPLLRRLLEDGWRVLLLGRRPPDFLSAAQSRKVRFLRADLERPSSLRRHAAELARASAALLAGGFVLRSTRPEDDDQRAALLSNVMGTAELLDLLGPGLAWLGYVSTLDVYGLPRRQPIAETHPTAPRTWYGVSKLAGERLCQVLAAQRGIPCAVLRLGQVYGPGDPSAKAIPSFLRAALAGGPIVVRGPGRERRGYVYVDDVVDAIERAVKREAAGVFNVAGRAVTVRQTADGVRAAAGLREPVRSEAGKAGVSLALDTRRARRGLGFAARTPLSRGLRLTLESLRHAR
jgi:UDP-glucose 4-epimerase